MPDKCPICFSDIGTPSPNDFIWTDDPIFSTPAPSIINNITDPPSLITYEQYLGFTRIKAQHIKELQDNRRQIETDLGLTHTVFSPIDTDNFFQNMETYVYELRTSTENILSAIGMTKEEYFNYDKDGNDMRPGNHQLDWIDIPFPVYNLRQYQSKSAHIEDLRHFIQVLWQETWENSTPATYITNSSFEGDQHKIWNVNLNNTAFGSFIQINSIKSLKINSRPTDLSGGEPIGYVNWNSFGLTKKRLPVNGNLYFEIIDINITQKTTPSPSSYSLDCVRININVATYFDGQIYPLTYYFNTNADFKSPPFSILFYELLKGDLIPGNFVYSLYDDLIAVWDGTHIGGGNLINYYNGVIDTKGVYIDSVLIGVGNTGIAPFYFQTLEIDNIKIRV